MLHYFGYLLEDKSTFFPLVKKKRRLITRSRSLPTPKIHGRNLNKRSCYNMAPASFEEYRMSVPTILHLLHVWDKLLAKALKIFDVSASMVSTMRLRHLPLVLNV